MRIKPLRATPHNRNDEAMHTHFHNMLRSDAKLAPPVKINLNQLIESGGNYTARARSYLLKYES